MSPTENAGSRPYLVGFSPHKDDEGAIALACQFARSESAAVHAVTVVPQGWPTAVAGDTDRDFEAWAAEQGEEAAAEAVALLARHPDIDGSASWCAGRSVPQALLDRVAELDASLVVVGSGSEGVAGRVGVSTKVDRLLHSSPVAVAVAPRGYRAQPTARIARATVAFRGDRQTWSLLDTVADIAYRVGATVRIVTFAVRGRTMRPGLVSGAEDMVLAHWINQAQTELAEALEHLHAIGFAESSVESVLAVGHSWGGAMDQLDWHREDVLVVGSSASGSRLAQVFLGSSAAKILRHSPVPVIVVP